MISTRQLIGVALGLLPGLLYWAQSPAPEPPRPVDPRPSPAEILRFKKIDEAMRLWRLSAAFSTSPQSVKLHTARPLDPRKYSSHMSASIIASGAGTTAANGTYLPNDANLASPVINAPFYAMSSGENFTVFNPNTSIYVWGIGPSGQNPGTCHYICANKTYSTLAAAIAAGPAAGSLYTNAAGSNGSPTGAAPYPTVAIQPLVVSGAGTSASNGTYSQTAASSNPSTGTALFSMANGANFTVWQNGMNSYIWINGPSGAVDSTTAWYAGTKVYSSLQAAVIGGPAGTYGTFPSGTTPVPTVGYQAAATPPSAPSSLTATPSTTQTAIQLAWVASPTSGVTYQVFRGTSAGGESTTPIAIGLSALNYTDTTVVSGTSYFYYIKAYDGTNLSTASNEASAVGPTIAVSPSAPTGVSIVNSSPGRVLSWTPVTGATSYSVYRFQSGSFTRVLQGFTGVSWNDLDSYSYGRARYYVTAVNSAGESNPSTIVLSDPLIQTSIMERATFLQGVQIGLETSQGVAVPATRKILGATFEHTPNAPVKARTGVGTKAAIGVQRSKVWTDFKMSGPISYNLLPYMAAALISAGVVPVPVGTGGTAYKFTFAVSPDVPDTPQTMTLEYGSAQGSNSRMSYSHFTDLSLKVNQNTADYEMSGFGQFPVDNIVMTKLNGVAMVQITNPGSGYTGVPTVTFSAPQRVGGVTALGTVIVSSNQVVGVTITNPGSGYTSAPTATFAGGGGTGAAGTTLFNRELPAILADPIDFRLNYASTIAGLSTGKLLKILDIELHINGRWKAAFFVDDANAGFGSSVELSPAIGGSLVTSIGSDSDTLLANLLNGDLIYTQLQGTGPLIEAGANASLNVYHSLKWTMPAYVTKPERGDNEDLYAGTYELTGAHDGVNGDLIVEIITTLPNLY